MVKETFAGTAGEGSLSLLENEMSIANRAGICYTDVNYTPGGVYVRINRFSAENRCFFA